MDIAVYDVEVVNGPDDTEGGWNNPEGMGHASSVVYDQAADQYRFFEGEAGRIKLIECLTGKLVVSFNGIKFDNRVVLGNDYQTAPHPWQDYDILLEVVKAKFGLPDVATAEKKMGDRRIHDGSISLDGISEGTFGLKKTGHGAHAPVLYAQKDFAGLYEYNLHDVRLTRKLFDFILQYGFVIDRKRNHIRLEKP